MDVGIRGMGVNMVILIDDSNKSMMSINKARRGVNTKIQVTQIENNGRSVAH